MHKTMLCCFRRSNEQESAPNTVIVSYWIDDEVIHGIDEATVTIPHNVIRMEIRFYPTFGAGIQSEVLTDILRRSSVRVQHMFVEIVFELSPEQSAMLDVAVKDTESLEIFNWKCDAAYECLAKGLSRPDGPKKLHIRFTEGISNSQGQLFFEGLAASTCLEELILEHVWFDDAEKACKALLNTLQRNPNLRSLKLDSFQIGVETKLQDIFKAAVLDARVQSLWISMDSEGLSTTKLPCSLFGDVLCQEDCKLQKLSLEQVDFIANADSEVSTATELSSKSNKSLTHCSMNTMDLRSTQLVQLLAPSFQSLVVLDLQDCHVSDLSMLDHLLIGGNKSLQKLEVFENMISEEDIIVFFRKLPKMKCLRGLALGDNPFLEGTEWMGVLETVIWQNTSLECLLFNALSEEYIDSFARINHFVSLNRGGQRALESTYSDDVPGNLWPLILERGGKMSYYDSKEDVWDKPSLTSPRVDVVFWMLREKIQW